MNREEDSRFASKPVEPTDAELVGQALSGSSRAFATLVRRHQGLISGVARRFGAYAGMEAADVVQDVFLHAYQVLGQLKNPERFAAWLYRLAVNRCLDIRRQSQARERAVQGLSKRVSAGSDDPVIEAVSRRETRACVREAVDRLGDDLKEVVYLRYYEGLAYERIAELLDVPMTTVDGRLRRAKAQLMQELSGRVEL